MSDARRSQATHGRLGLRENLPQFALLVVLNAFVGAMVGLERTVLPLLGEQEFGLGSKTAITSFIVSFGVTKAVVNLVAALAPMSMPTSSTPNSNQLLVSFGSLLICPSPWPLSTTSPQDLFSPLRPRA